MAIDTDQEKIISLLNRDFKSTKRDLITFSKAYATGSFTDFNESSAGMAILELVAYIGDGLNYYIDQAFNESGDGATQIENIAANAKSRGYKPAGKKPAIGSLLWAVEVPATANSFGQIVPDSSYAPVIYKSSQAVAKNGAMYETLEDIDFSDEVGRSVTGSQFDSTTGSPTHFAMMKSVDAISGKSVTESFTITDFLAFRKIDLAQSDVIEIISVVDSSGNEWFEVDYLAQDWVFTADTNVNSDSDIVPYVMKLVTAPYRFETDRDIETGITTLIFGSGDGTNFDDELIPNVASYALPLAGRRTYGSYSIDPQNFLKTRSLGLSPHNTTLTVTYRVGGGEETNVPARAIRQPSSVNMAFSSTGLDALKKGRVEGSVGVLNLNSMTGGGPAETAREIKTNAAAYFAAQNRIVSREDVIARTLSIPAKFGKPEKVYVKPSELSRFSYDIHLLSKDSNGNLSTATSTLKSNIATYLSKFKMLTDGINILDSDILNVRCYFGITVAGGRNRSEVLTNCSERLKLYFSLDRMQIGKSIVISDVVAVLQAITGVVSVYEISFSNVFGITDGLVYSDSRFNIAESLKNGMLICPQNSIFELKYPMKDIVGSAK